MPETQAPDLDEVRRRLAILFNQNQAMVERYIQVHGPKISIKAIQEIREEVGSTPPPVVPVVLSAPDGDGLDPNLESPVFTIEVECPCCHKKEIPHRDLRASSMSIKNDAFLAPAYFPVGKFQKLNFLTVNVTVCPRCLFASPDKKDFIQFNRTTRQNIQSQISPGILSEIQDTMAERQELVELSRLGNDFTKCPRTLQLGALSYKLAEQRAKVESESKQPFAILKRANYWTRVALLQRQAGIDDTQALEHALTQYKEAFYRTDFPNPNSEFQACFIIFSIQLRFGLVKEARDYIGVMEQSKKAVSERKDAAAALQALEQWLGMAKGRWDDRENPELWGVPK